MNPSILTGQLDPRLLPNICFPPLQKMEAVQLSVTKFVYSDLFEKLLQNGSTVTPAIKSDPLLQQFNSLSLNDQLVYFTLSQQLTTQELVLRWQVAFDILAILRNEWSNCEASVFGSLLTGLCDPRSDIDISIDPSGDNYKSLEETPKGERKKVIKEIRTKVKKLLLEAESLHFPPEPFAAKLMVLGRKVPIIRFLQPQTKISVDVSFGNRTSVQNSRLLRFYMEFDPRVGQLIVFLRYWAKFHRISGSDKVKQYAIALIALVYFTQKKIVPSVLLLQCLSNIQRAEQGISDKPPREWDPSFCDDLEVISKYFKRPTSGTDSPDVSVLFEMLSEFFELMISTNFGSVVVCPLVGMIVPKGEIATTVTALIDLLPDHPLKTWRKSHFKGNSMCSSKPLSVQDPFELNFNVGGVCKKDNLDRFQSACRSTLEILKKKERPESLLELFVASTSPPKVKVKKENVKTENGSKLLKVSKSESKQNGTPSLKQNRAMALVQEILTNVDPHRKSSVLIPNGKLSQTEKIVFRVTNPFVETFIKELGQGYADSVLKCQITSLWRTFAISFVERFMTQGLQLTVKNTKRVEVCPSSEEKGDPWVLGAFEKNGDKMTSTGSVIKNIHNLPKPPKKTLYMIQSVEVAHHFWGRPRIEYDAIKDPVKMERFISGKALKWSKRKLRRETSSSGDPIHVFTPFLINLMVKLDARVNDKGECVRPSITFVVQEAADKPAVTTDKAVVADYKKATQSIIGILCRTFQANQLYQLTKWLEKNSQSKKSN